MNDTVTNAICFAIGAVAGLVAGYMAARQWSA